MVAAIAWGMIVSADGFCSGPEVLTFNLTYKLLKGYVYVLMRDS